MLLRESIFPSGAGFAPSGSALGLPNDSVAEKVSTVIENAPYTIPPKFEKYLVDRPSVTYSPGLPGNASNSSLSSSFNETFEQGRKVFTVREIQIAIALASAAQVILSPALLLCDIISFLFVMHSSSSTTK